jgi:multidrug efflux system outer membrane protein
MRNLIAVPAPSAGPGAARTAHAARTTHAARTARGARAAIAALAAAMAIFTLAGCTVGPRYQRPPVAAPQQFYGLAGQAQAASLADLPWWEVFKDPVLKALVEEALRNGYDVKIAAARIEEARARYGIAGSAFFPQVGYNGQFARERVSGFEPGVGTNGLVTDLVTVNVPTVSWELDIWGRIRRLTEAARAQYLATEEARHGVVLTLVSQVASAYFDLRQLDEDLDIAHRNTAAFHDTFDLFNKQLQGGIASALDTSDAEAAWANEAAQIPLLESQIVAKENQLALLLGRNPGPISRGESLFKQPLPAEVPAGLPAALLMRRPDVRQFEQQLVAANADIGVAEAAFYPTISLTGMFGGLSPDLKNLFGKGQTWLIGGGLMGPIFQGGNLRSQYRLAAAQFEEAKLQYEQVVTRAFGEVSTALVALEKLAVSEKERQRAVNAYGEAVRLANLRYTSGLSAYFEVIDAQENLLNAENLLAQVRHDRLIALADLYKALGGGWETAEPAANPPAASLPAPGAAPTPEPAATSDAKPVADTPTPPPA